MVICVVWTTYRTSEITGWLDPPRMWSTYAMMSEMKSWAWTHSLSGMEKTDL